VDLQRLRIFVAVAEESNVTRAARRLSLSQPGLSKQLAELEESLRTQLFDRLPRAAELELGELVGLRSGRLSIGASTTIGSYLIPGVFGAFHREHPQVTLELEIANTALIQAMVADGRIDLGLSEGVVPGEQFAFEVAHYDEMVAIAAPGHPLLRKRRLVAADLARTPFISRERGSGTREVIERALAERGLSIEPAMALGSTEAVKNAVAAGVGVAIVSRLTVELELTSGRLSLLEVRDLSLRRELHLLQLRGKQPSPAAQAFIGLLRAALRPSPG
jgi:DNA-binding transcriptional LysR family regulator